MSTTIYPCLSIFGSQHLPGGRQGWAWLHQARGQGFWDVRVWNSLDMIPEKNPAVTSSCLAKHGALSGHKKQRTCWTKLVGPNPSSLSPSRSCLGCNCAQHIDIYWHVISPFITFIVVLPRSLNLIEKLINGCSFTAPSRWAGRFGPLYNPNLQPFSGTGGTACHSHLEMFHTTQVQSDIGNLIADENDERTVMVC